MTNFEPPAKPEDTVTPIDRLSSPFKRAMDWARVRRMDSAAKRKAMLTACGQTLSPDQRALKIGFGIIFEALTLLLGLIFLWFNAIFFFLQNERVELSGLKPDAALWFSEKFDGQSADLDSLEVQYRKTSGSLALVAKNVVIKGDMDDTLLTLPQLDSQFDLSDLIFGKFIPRKTVIEGGAVTGRFAKDGQIQFGLGTPQSFERLGADFNIDRSKTSQSGGYDWRNINQVTLKNVNVYIINVSNSITHHFIEVDGSYIYADSVLAAKVRAKLNAAIPVPLQIDFDSDDTFELIRLKLAVQGFNPAKLNRESGAFTKISGLDAPVDGAINVTLGKQATLKDLALTVTAVSGQWRASGIAAPFKAAKISADYDAETRQITIKTAKLASDRLSFSGSGTIAPADAQTPLGLKSPFRVKLNLRDISGNPGEGFDGPYAAKTADINAEIDPVFRDAIIDALDFDVGNFKVSLKGDASAKAQDGPFELEALNLSGGAQGALTQKDVLKYWPRNLSPAARNWVRKSILKADVPRMNLRVNLTGESLSRGYLLDDELSLEFPVQNTIVKYISTMTPMTDAAGSGILRGNSFSIGVESARLGDGIEIKNSRVDIERFLPLGGTLKVVVNGAGEMEPLLRLIDEPPFGYGGRFGLKPDEFTGNGTVNYVFTRPVGMPDRKDLITHTVSADFIDVTAPVNIGPHRVQNGQLHLDVDADGLRLFGQINVGPWPAQFSLTDAFDDGGGNADYSLTGTMTRDDFDKLGIGFREYFSGDVGVAIKARGNGLSVEESAITADLRQADLRFSNIWSKPAGRNGTLSARLSRNELGGAQISDVTIQAAGLDIQGSAKFGPDFRLLSLNLPVTKLDGFIDSAIVASTPAAGELALTLRGDYLSLEPWVAAALAPRAPRSGFPLGVSGTFSRLKLRNDLVLTDAKLGLKNTIAGLSAASVIGQQGGKAFSVDLKTVQDGVRDLDVRVPDAGDAMRQIFSFDNISSGALHLTATLPQTGAPGPISGKAHIDDFILADAPVFARILTLASLTGLGEVMSGDGMSFETLHAPFEFEAQQLTLKEARASGPAIGMTASGLVNFDAKTMDVSGVLVPAYTFNSVLGNIPLLGDIVVGKEGEGIFALNYSVDGDFAKTQVAVNPLSAFAPGFLRRMFDQPLAEKAMPTADPRGTADQP